jgi:hypothetical protein
MTTVLESRTAPTTDHDFSDDELTAMALAADPDEALDADAQPWTEPADGLLPNWYMPAPVAHRRGGWRRAVAILVIVAFLVINACGLCITYGHLVIA